MAEYREITRAEINAFLRSAVILAMAKPQYINGGVRVVEVTLTADGIPRLDFDNGDFIFLDFEHLVPRDSTADPLREKGSTDTSKAFYGAECPSYPNCGGGCGLGCTHEIETARADNEAGMAWWNGLTEQERGKWAEIAGNTGRAKDAWEAFKRARTAGVAEKAVP
jgi:hypothetical protein